jgi:hypothetical protein
MDDKIRISHEVEIKRCAEDFVYFCENYVKISHPTRGLINFILHPYQKRYAKALQDNRYLIAKKFRQGGFTTLTQVYFLWLAMFKLDQRIMTISKTDRECCYMSDIVRRIIDQFPEWLQPKLGKNNDHTIEFEDTGCKMHFCTPEPAKGKKTDYILFDEAAFWANADRYWKAYWPMISCGGRAYIVSTTNGTKDNWFYDTYTAAEKLENSFKIFHCSYLEHPDYADENWAANTKLALGGRGWRQEVLCEFLDQDTRTHQEKLDDTIHFFEEISAAEELVENLNRCEQPKVNKFVQEVNRTEMWDIKDNRIEDINLDWGLEEVYTETPKPFVEEIPEYKPQAYQFKRMTAQEQKAYIEEFHKITPAKVDHPEFDQLGNLNNAEELSEFWTDVAEVYPEYEEIKDFWVKISDEQKERREEIEDKLNEHFCDALPDLLVLSGLITKSEAQALPQYKTFARPDKKIIDTIKSSGKYPKEMDLSFSKDRLCINKVPTVIKEDDVRDLYNGMFSLVGYEQAIDSAVKAITSKLDNLFLEADNAESLDKKQPE